MIPIFFARILCSLTLLCWLAIHSWLINESVAIDDGLIERELWNESYASECKKVESQGVWEGWNSGFYCDWRGKRGITLRMCIGKRIYKRRKMSTRYWKETYYRKLCAILAWLAVHNRALFLPTLVYRNKSCVYNITHNSKINNWAKINAYCLREQTDC